MPEENTPKQQKAAEMTARFIRSIKHLVQGVHITPLGWTDIVPEILNRIASIATLALN